MVATVLPTTHLRGLAPLWEVPIAVGLGVAAVLTAGTGPVTVTLLYLAAVTPALVRSDLTVRRLPNRLVLPAYVVLIVALVAQGVIAEQFPVVAVLSGLGYFGLLFALSLAGGMGMGDVKLAGALGLSAGMLGVEAAIVSPLLAFLAGGVAATITFTRSTRGTRIPFGPFILAGFWTAVLLPL
jgi:leader peptidase (prepilin peptidase) / N-methyltransferase